VRKFKTIFLSLLLAFCTLSCGKSADSSSGALKLSLEYETVSYRADGCFVNIEASGYWTLGLTADSAQVTWARLNKTSGYGKATAVLSYDVNNSAKNRSLTVTLSSSGATPVEKTFTQKAFNAEPEPPASVPSWMELPAQLSGYTFYSHSFKYQSKIYRNYSFVYDDASRLALWVAYPLCSFYSAKKTSRTDEWGFDPDVPSTVQPDLSRSYSGYYDRGHQLPSADRLVCYEANAQTFYYTNMTPQMSSFNQGVWGNLEGNVRSWAEKSDTLYVVTGCVMSGSTASTTDAVGNKCPIPAAYFKAVLRYSKSSTIGWGGYIAAGLYFKHTATSSIAKDNIKSITELEKLLGYKLFVNLEKQTGSEVATKIKSQDPTTVSFWGF